MRNFVAENENYMLIICKIMSCIIIEELMRRLSASQTDSTTVNRGKDYQRRDRNIEC